MTNDMLCVALMSILVLFVLAIPLCLLFRQKFLNKKLVILVYVLMLVWIIRFTVGTFSDLGEESGLTVPETLLDSLIHTLQTFSMDEDYTLYTIEGKKMLVSMGLPVWASVYGVVISLLNVCAPILGGALLLDILTSIFPSIRLYLMPYRHKFVFSELNNESITLAEDIVRNKHYKELGLKTRRKPAILFADAYLDDESEVSSELFGRAQAIGAICLKTDLLHIALERSKSVDYLLINTNSQDNLIMLSQLLEGNENGSTLWPATESDDPVTRIFLFGQDDLDHDIVKQICDKNGGNKDKVLIRTIRDEMNTVFHLMDKAPLFLPLLSKPDSEQKDLFVTIIGSNRLAEAAFKTVFWCGQIQDTKLHINVIANDASELKWRIEERCPELLESCKAGSPLLKVKPFDSASNFNPPYCQSIGFIDVCNLELFSEYPTGLQEQTDYFIISLDTDEENLRMTEQLKRVIERNGLTAPKQRHPVLVPVVKNHRLAQSINVLEPKANEPYIISVGSIESRYSVESVFMKTFSERRMKGKIYNPKEAEEIQNDEYSYWSSIARVVHAPYKLYGLGLIKRLCLDKENREKYIINRPVEINDLEGHQIAWIEHRRWNAYLRSEGFVCPTKEQYDAFFQMDNTHKSISLKLHPCLVESQVIPVCLPIDLNYDKTRYDNLDYASIRKYELERMRSGEAWTPEGLRQKDLKQYDYIEKRRVNDKAMKYFLSEELASLVEE